MVSLALCMVSILLWCMYGIYMVVYVWYLHHGGVCRMIYMIHHDGVSVSTSWRCIKVFLALGL